MLTRFTPVDARTPGAVARTRRIRKLALGLGQALLDISAEGSRHTARNPRIGMHSGGFGHCLGAG